MKNRQNSKDEQRKVDKGQRIASGVSLISKGKYSAALWATELYERFGLRKNIHIRRLHYHALMQEGLKLPSSKAYRNTLADYEYLKTAFEYARLLGYVPYDVFSGYGRFDYTAFPESVGKCGNNSWRQLLNQRIEQTLRNHMSNMLARLAPVHIEIWLEQTTADDLVTPIAEKYHLNILKCSSDISLTNIWHFIRRIGNVSRPVRILYICDFNPHAISTAAEKVKAVISQYGLSRSVDLKIIKLALGHNECRQYNLPYAPDSGDYRSNLVEIHALEVAAPGFLCQTLQQNIDKYLDSELLKVIEKQIKDSISRLMVDIMHQVYNNSDFYEIYSKIESATTVN